MDYRFKTRNHTFTLRVSDEYKPVHMRTFTIGGPTNRCLEASLIMPDANPLFSDKKHICNIAQIDSLASCLIDQDPDKPQEDVSMGAELMYGFINILKVNYTHITQLALQDASYLPCNRATSDTLDLLSYNIALYGKTWYEMKFGAHLENPVRQTKYEDSIRYYMSPQAKRETSWDSFYADIILRNKYAKDEIVPNENVYRDIFLTSETWPICITRMKNRIDKTNRCKFFKGWLESLIEKYVTMERRWIIDIDVNPVLGNVLNTRTARPMGPRVTRRNRSRNRRRRRS
jgi:hypothetical protein